MEGILPADVFNAIHSPAGMTLRRGGDDSVAVRVQKFHVVTSGHFYDKNQAVAWLILLANVYNAEWFNEMSH